MSVRTIRHPAASELDLATILRTLGDPARLAIVRLLQEDGERRCTAIGAQLAIPSSTLSYHLRQLREAGVTRTRAEGTERYSSLRAEDLDVRFPGLLEALRERQPER